MDALDLSYKKVKIDSMAKIADKKIKNLGT